MAAIYGRVLILLCIVFGACQAEKHVRLARQAPASGWSEWSIWSACSRSCGGGVSYQERHCLSGDGTCVGPQRTYRSCQIQDCPEGAVDFRLEQCAAFNTVPYEGQLFSWVPYEGGPNPCELNCMPKGEHFYYPQAEKVVDGTRCRRDGLDVCVDGVCRSVGCDMMLDSHTEEDMCRDCGGDNSTCKLFEGRFTRRKIPEGYNDIHIIPIGATNGRIAEIRGSHNYLALRNADGVFYLNGDFRIELPRTFQAAGTSIKYQRKVGSTQQKPEVITFVGPLTEPLFIVILTQTKNHGIEYSYYVPNGVGPDKPDTYSWTYTPYSNCTKECGGGHQARKVTCTRSGDYETVPSYLCDPELKPRSNRSCNTNPCPPSWYVGEWSPCSQSCDEGSQVRQVYCQRVNQHGRPEPIEETYCLAVLGFKPPYQQDCTLQTCPHWEAGNWSECSVACGFGTETRRVQCVADLIEPDESCDADDKPIDEQDCNLGPCAGVEWMKTEWTRCTGVCGAGSRSRQMFCATQAGTVFPKDLCDMDDMPDMTRSCPLAGECGARWVATDWSQCSATCGGGVHSRLVFCGEISNGNALVQVPDSDCNPRTKFQMEEMCNMELCFDDYVWFTGPWGKCTVPCGGGTRTRVLVCMKGETPQRQALCPSGNAPLASQPCNIGPCTPATTQKIQPVTSILQASSIKTSQEKVVTLKTVTTEKTSEVPSTTAPYTETTFSKISTVGATHIPTSSGQNSTKVAELSSTKSTRIPTTTTSFTTPSTTFAPTAPHTISHSFVDHISPARSNASIPAQLLTAQVARSVAMSKGVATTAKISGDHSLPSTNDTRLFSAATRLVPINDHVVPTMAKISNRHPVATTTVPNPRTTTKHAEITNSHLNTSSATKESAFSSTSSLFSTIHSTHIGIDHNISVDATTNTVAATQSSSLETSAATNLHNDDSETVLKTNATTATTFHSHLESTKLKSSAPPASIATTPTLLPKHRSGPNLDLSTSAASVTTLQPEPLSDDSFNLTTINEGTTLRTFAATQPPQTPSTSRMISRTKTPSVAELNLSTDFVAAQQASKTAMPQNVQSVANLDLTTLMDISWSSTAALQPNTPSEEDLNLSTSVATTSQMSSNTPVKKHVSVAVLNVSTSMVTTPQSSPATLPPKTSSVDDLNMSMSELFTTSEDLTTTHLPQSQSVAEVSSAGVDTTGATSSTMPTSSMSLSDVFVTSSLLDESLLDERLNDNGIACDESEFGCCQDGVTAASGPYKQGCRPCDESEFKCCPDGVTAAKGLNYAGCEDETDPEVVEEAEESVGCAETEFGCCGNQVDAATGPNFEGCDDTVQDACLLPMNPGICRAWIVKFFFNTHYGQCTQFWYGGCGGNDNLFDTYDECKNECIGVDEPLPQEDLCVLPMDVGPCKGSFDRFYYNSKTDQCESFKYGGCRGNENSFRSQDDCEIVCGNINADPCSLEADYGGCRGSDLRWYFNTDSSMCEEFEYSGCHGNQNRFPDKQSCEQRCNANVIDILPQVSPYDQCSMPADSGACSEALPQWAYDVRTGQCKEFVYNGCEGNYNRFETELSCQEACYVEGKTLCERMQALFRASGVEDQPECKLDGSYEPLQCPPRTGDCWCVTDLGEEIDGSRITRQSLTIRPDCARYPNSAGHRKVVIETTTPDMASLTLCQRHQRTAEGSYVPQCTASGEYENMQCFGNRMDYCWCVNATGEEIKFTRTLPGERKPHCEGIEDSVCFRAYRDVMSGLVDSEYMPQCSPQGLFSRLQCQTERGCLCVNETNGNVIFAVDVDPQLATPRSCDGVSTRVLTSCQAQRQEILISGGAGSGEDGFIPQCTEDGAYQDLQCHEGRASYCWCVNQDGEEIPRTRLRGGVPDCKQGAPTSSANTNSPSITNSPGSTESPAITNSPAIESPAITNSPAIESPALPTEGSTRQESTTIAKAQTTRATGPEETTTAEARAIEATTAITTTNVMIVESEATIIGGGDEIIADEEEDEDCTDSSNCQGGSSASINQSPSAIVARPGNMVILTCEATGVPTPTITWRRDGQDVSTLDDRFIASQDGTLTILDSKVSDSGPYVCVADNNVGDPDTATFEITVAERSRPQRPRGHRQLRIKTREGESVTMNCRARADPTPVITWDFQGLELSDIEPRITKRPGGSLQIDDVSVADIGTYKCTARNMYGIIQMRTFTLIVEADVQIVNPPTSTKAMEGETITLHCGTTGSPKPKIRWNVDTNPVPLTSRFVIGTNDQLTIRDIKRSDAGEYSCSAANGISSKTAYATVAVAGDNEDDPNCQDQPKYMACQLIVFANLCQTHPYYKYCCRTCRDNGMLPTTTAAP